MHKCVGYAKDVMTPSTSIESIISNAQVHDVRINSIEISSENELCIDTEATYDVKLDKRVLECKFK